MNSAPSGRSRNAARPTKKTRRKTPAGLIGTTDTRRPTGGSRLDRLTCPGSHSLFAVGPLPLDAICCRRCVSAALSCLSFSRSPAWRRAARRRDDLQVAQYVVQVVQLLAGQLDLEPVVGLHAPVLVFGSSCSVASLSMFRPLGG